MIAPHVETIAWSEKLAPSLGGTGYLPPAQPATREELRADAALHEFSSLNTAVWKVARRSVRQWDRPWRDNRILRVHGAHIRARVIGSQRDWYFVAVEATAAAKALA